MRLINGAMGAVPVLGVVLCSSAAVAQEKLNAEPGSSVPPAVMAQVGARGTLSKLVATAGEEKLAIDTPQSVTTLDQEDLDEKQASTMADLLEDIPGVSMTGGASALGQSFNIRGIGAAVAGDESKIIVQVDGVNKFHEQYRVGSFFSEPELYKRVEVLRGPASSTLYGTGALAGVISFVTKDASDFLQDDDRFAVRLKAGYETNSANTFGSGIVAVKPAQNLDLLLVYNNRNSDDYENGDGKKIVPSDVSSSSFLIKSRYNLGGRDDHAIWASYENWQSDTWQLYDQQFTITTAMVQRKVDDKTAVLGYVNGFGDSKLFDISSQVSYTDSFVTQSENQFSPTALGLSSEYSYATVQAKLGNTSEVALFADGTAFINIGVQGYEQQRSNPRLLPSGVTQYGATTHPEGDTQMLGIYAQAEMLWADTLTVIPGVRVDRQKLDPGNGVVATTTAKNTATSPKLALLWQIAPQVGVFGSIAKTERLPTLDEMYSRTGARNANLNLEPEVSTNDELGFTLKFGGFAFKATGFRNEVTNLITTATTGALYSINIGKAKYEGVELEAEYTSRYFFARAGAANITGEDRITGLPLNTIPADELSVTAGVILAPQALVMGWRGEFAAEQDKVSGTGVRTGGYSAHNLFATWKPASGWLDGTHVRLGVDNVFDKTFRRHLASLDAEGRSVKLSVAHTF